MEGTAHGEEIVLTPDGYERLRAEHDLLVRVKLPRASARLADATVDTDSAEVGEYLDARAELELVQERIGVLESRLRAARVLAPDEAVTTTVGLGSRVTIEDLDEGSRESYVVVSSAESDPLEGRLSNESPVGRALEGRRAGERIDVHTPHGVRHLRIVGVRARR